eukprot:gnl/Ergobibamus_cyprinoides/1362.p3 GENE.gnl/Ergobibamus_cyprinoides/1362~~gnl/Ergobibamus_cyprinoides/1362.p3  ORF type:complete len:218 (-),score=17.91 gnl/Ergobibamus_cyprinoides/1362:683-1336(-)
MGHSLPLHRALRGAPAFQRVRARILCGYRGGANSASGHPRDISDQHSLLKTLEDVPSGIPGAELAQNGIDSIIVNCLREGRIWGISIDKARGTRRSGRTSAEPAAKPYATMVLFPEMHFDAVAVAPEGMTPAMRQESARSVKKLWMDAGQERPIVSCDAMVDYLRAAKKPVKKFAPKPLIARSQENKARQQRKLDQSRKWSTNSHLILQHGSVGTKK